MTRLMLAAMQQHQSSIRALRDEEAAVLARCELMESIMQQSLKPSELHVDQRGDHHSQKTYTSPKSRRRPRDDDVNRTAGAPHPSSADDDVVIVSERRVEVPVAEAVASSDSPQCTPSEILDECEKLFGAGSSAAICVNSNPNATANPTVTTASAVTTSGKRGGVKIGSMFPHRGVAACVPRVRDGGGMRGTKEKHPKALGIATNADDDGEARDSERARPYEPPQTPAEYWDLSMNRSA